ncbi:TonB-dependent receptor plug domain-containing protein [Marinobacter fonticola]|uniref:TonB-dependent receptor plug domain-containing protein n=1 Tax=Marinobacter fonticola TaxID=2603215 RepID=UPI0011E65AEE|nr:TonB-dependent receptor [Marinobacter fonticola]
MTFPENCARPSVASGTLLCTLLAGTPLLAAETSALPLLTHNLYLDELVITGTRTPRKVSDTPVRTEVVSGEDIRNTHAHTVKEALEYAPGVLLREIHGKAGYEVWMQGLNADRVRVLIDGLPMTATTGSSVDVSQLDTLDIERIEIVKGAVSAQYGSSAMGGVVNIVTRPIDAGVSARATVDGGTYGDQNPSGEALDFARRNGQANLDLGGEHVRYRLSATRQETDGIDPEPETWARPGDAIERAHVTNRLEWLPSDGHRIYGQVNYFREDGVSRYSLVNPGRAPAKAGKDELAERWRGALVGQHVPTSGPQWHWSLLHENLENNTRKYTAARSFDNRDATHTLSQASGWTQFEPLEDHQLQLGTDLRHTRLEQYKDRVSELSGEEDASQNSKELWLQDTWFASPHWEWVGGVRFQHDSDFGDHFAPKVNARYDLFSGDAVNIYLRGGWGAGYRVPNLKERHYLFDHSQLGYIVNGNPDLEPEESDSYQLGWGLTYRNTAWFEVNAFLNNIDRLIQTDVDEDATAAREDNIQVFRYTNVDRARTQGFEVTAGWQFRPGWKLSAGYTYLDAEDRDTGQPLTRRPEHQGTLSLDGLTPVPGMAWLARLRSQSDEVVDANSGHESSGFTTIDLKLNQDLGDNLRLFTGVNNLTDAQRNFNDANDFGPVSGRYIYAGVTLGFGNPL